MNIALFSYNAFTNAQNGWNKGETNNLFLVQNPDGAAWGLTQKNTMEGFYEEANSAIGSGWEHLASIVEKIDLFVVYVGSYGAERAIELCRDSGIPASKIIFVMCDCNYATKTRMIERCGYRGSQQIDCECGGRSTMSRLFRKYLDE